MNPTLLRLVYRKHGIKQKRLKWTKKGRDYDPEADRRKLASVKGQLTRAKNDGYLVHYIDETMVTRTTIPKAEWTKPKENMTIDQANLNEPTLALLAGISKDRGLEHYQIFEKSVNVDKFKEYLAGVRAANPEKRICLFMDNLGAHTSKKSTKEMQRLGFRWIFNVPYSPE